MKVHIQVQSKLDNGEVGKLSYRARGPFQLIEDLGNNSYHVKGYNDTNSIVRKYKETDFYLLPPAIFPSDLSTQWMCGIYINPTHQKYSH